ncbi:Actin family,Actin, conserved site [Cinara cedri]|uniref:Actin family,Actin, conserved site n=1 Tax=Cinara cedri TaxID=506608 RepID=A0A5E4MDC2_9HEMI|nr:Actin family,Actin, conserved site [Cinara cedri]
MFKTSSACSTIICDNGSYLLKAGFAGDDFPRAIIPTIVGTPRKQMNITGYGLRAMYAGEFAVENIGILDINRPIVYDDIQDWDAMENIWYHMYYENLLVPPEDFNILHTEGINNPIENRKKLMEIMFELFNVPNAALIPKLVLPLYGNGKTTGLSIDSGFKQTHVVPIYEGYPLRHAMRSMPIGGQHITKYLMKQLNDRGYSFTTSKSWEEIREIKEKMCYCALDFEKEISTFSKNKEQQYKLPDGMIVSIKTEAFKSPEILFNPALFDIENEQGGLHDIVQSSCSACNINEQSTMYENIVLAGGTSKFPFLTERLESMLKKLNLSTTKIKITARPERKYSTWIGGSILASISTFSKVWISKSEYEERGQEIIQEKCIF